MNTFENEKETPNLNSGSRSQKPRKLPYLIVGVMLVISILLGVTYLVKKYQLEAAGNEANGEQDLVNVVTLTLEPTTIKDRINLPAVVEPWLKLEIMAEVRGKVVQKVVEEGANVKKGDLIAVLDNRDYQNAYNSAKAIYESAKASFDRYAELYKVQLATKSQIDTARANMENAKASMDTAALSVDRCRITAPFTGILNRVYFEKDQYVNTGEVLAELLQIDRVKINVGIPESDVEAVRQLDSFDISFDALGGRVVRGTKVYLSKTTESMARLYSLKLAVDNPDHAILPDMFARVEIVKKEENDSLVVPVYSVISRNDKNYVFVLHDKKTVVLRPIETGLQESWRIEVTGGLSTGDRVVVVGHRNIEDGQIVNVTKNVESMEALEG